MSDKKQRFADFLGIDEKEFEKPEESTDKRVSDLESAMNILLSGEVNEELWRIKIIKRLLSSTTVVCGTACKRFMTP